MSTFLRTSALLSHSFTRQTQEVLTKAHKPYRLPLKESRDEKLQYQTGVTEEKR